MIAVYHSEEMLHRVYRDGAYAKDENGNPIWEDRKGNPPVFHHVADVDLPDEAHAQVFPLTNSIDGPWWENDGVTANFDSPAFFEVEGRKGTRSTSVGDVILLSDGRWLQCVSVGWVEITPPTGLPDASPEGEAAPKFTDFDATMIAEGVQEPAGDTDEEKEANYLAAWQHLIDTGLAWKLQGWFGRRAAALIDEGHCSSGAVTL